MAASEQDVARFLEWVGAGALDRIIDALDREPALVNAVGPHPFWGGRPQALHLAIEGNRRDIFDLLLERGADVSGINDGYDHWSPVMLSINRHRSEMTATLLQHGARLGLLEALMIGDDATVLQMLRDGPLPPFAPNGGSILAFARTRASIDRLLELGASTTQTDRWGSTPLDAFSRLGAAGHALVAHMIERGVPARPQDYARMGDLERLRGLVEADPGVAALEVVIMAAVDFRQYAVVRWLLEQGAPVNARSDAQSRHTALHSAAWNGDAEMVRLLVAAGADPTLRDAQYGATPQGWAETSAQVTNNPACRAVAALLSAAI